MINAETSNTIHDVKWKIADKGGFEGDLFCLKFGNLVLEDEATLSHYGIQQGCVLFMALLPFNDRKIIDKFEEFYIFDGGRRGGL